MVVDLRRNSSARSEGSSGKFRLVRPVHESLSLLLSNTARILALVPFPGRSEHEGHFHNEYIISTPHNAQESTLFENVLSIIAAEEE